MAKTTLIMALHYARNEAIPAEFYSFQEEGVWFITRRGPTYINLYKVDMADLSESDVRKLEAIRRPDEGGAS